MNEEGCSVPAEIMTYSLAGLSLIALFNGRFTCSESPFPQQYVIWPLVKLTMKKAQRVLWFMGWLVSVCVGVSLNSHFSKMY